MTSTKQDFEENCKEIDKYFDFLEKIELGFIILNNPIPIENDQYEIDTELTNILKANTFLLLYNLTESTIRNLLWEIFLNLKQKNVPYNKLVSEIRLLFIERKISLDFNSTNETLTNQVISLIDSALEDLHQLQPSGKDKIVLAGGNLGFSKIQETFKKYGIRNITQRNNQQPIYFDETKKNRNSLAHGEKTFKDCGKNYSFGELHDYKVDMMEFLERIIGVIDLYLEEEKYLI